MSMHEIEDLVEGAIRVLDAHDRGADLRDLDFALFEFQRMFDCGFTHGRVLDRLVAHGHTFVLPLAAHPAYEEHGEAFDEAAKVPEITFVSDIVDVEDEDDDADDEVGNEHGYLAEGKLHCDLGTPLWAELVARKVLKGRDAKAPANLSIGKVAVRVARAAEKAGDTQLLGMWHALGPDALFGDAFTRRAKKGEVLGVDPFTGEERIADAAMDVPRPFTAKEAKALPEAAELLEIARRTGATTVELADDLRPPPEARTDLEAWWFGP